MSPKILHNTNIPEFKKWVRKSKNYRPTKKKKKRLFGFSKPKNRNWVPKAKYYRMTKKKKKKRGLRLFRIIAHQKKILHNFQKFYTILDRADRRLFQLCPTGDLMITFEC